MKKTKLLLHICCAPDATVPCPELIQEGYDVTGFFYGGNIHPKEEYDKRALALASVCKYFEVEAIYQSYSPQLWFDATVKMKDEPEHGKRCVKCFELQLETAAEYAQKTGFTHLSTTLTISPHKDPELINEIGKNICQRIGLLWVEKIWRKDNGFKKSVEKSKQLGIYRQNYCGCLYSI